jgi:hypothetical protein
MMFDLPAETPRLLPGKPPFDERCAAWYWQPSDPWTRAHWARCWSRAKRYRDVDGNIAAVCGVHARSRKILASDPTISAPS